MKFAEIIPQYIAYSDMSRPVSTRYYIHANGEYLSDVFDNEDDAFAFIRLHYPDATASVSAICHQPCVLNMSGLAYICRNWSIRRGFNGCMLVDYTIYDKYLTMPVQDRRFYSEDEARLAAAALGIDCHAFVVDSHFLSRAINNAFEQSPSQFEYWFKQKLKTFLAKFQFLPQLRPFHASN